MVSSRLFPRRRDPEVVELLEDLNLSVAANLDFENAVCLVQFQELEAENSNCGAFSQANLMKLFNVIENLIDSQIDGERIFEVTTYSFLLFPENLDRFGENLNLVHQKTERLCFRVCESLHIEVNA